MKSREAMVLILIARLVVKFPGQTSLCQVDWQIALGFASCNFIATQPNSRETYSEFHSYPCYYIYIYRTSTNLYTPDSVCLLRSLANYPFRCTKKTVKGRQDNGKRWSRSWFLAPPSALIKKWPQYLIKVKSVFWIHSRPYIPPKLA